MKICWSKHRGDPSGSPFECESRSGIRSGFGGGLDAGIVLEELLVDVGVLLPLGRQLIIDEDRLDGADRFARTTVDALIRMDVEHRLALVDAIHGTDFHAGLVLDIDAGFRDHVRHSDLPMTQMYYPAHARVRKPRLLLPTCPSGVKLSTDAGWGGSRRQSVRSLGSRASRRESPKRLNANTARLMARPGNSPIHGACSANSTAAPLSIRPQAAVGSCTPRPRKDSDASRRMACPRKDVSMIR